MKFFQSTGKRNWLILCNILLICAMLLTTAVYSGTIMKQKNALQKDTFCNTIESLKQVSKNYLSMEKSGVNDWASYIEARHMNADEALDYIRTASSYDDRAAHLVDMETLSARSSYLQNGSPWIDYYENTRKLNTISSQAFLGKMQQIYESDKDALLVLGKYSMNESHTTVISVGTRVLIREADGTDRPYLLLRLIPVEYLQKSWVFPIDYADAEVSLISQDGGYIVQSPSLRSRSFPEFIRSYNFAEDDNQMYQLEKRLKNEDNGLLEYQDAKGEPCYFYFSSIGEAMDLDILGYIPVSHIKTEGIDWTIVNIIGGGLLLLMFLDGFYMLSMNNEQRKTLRMLERANQAKTQFLSSMSHDIRTPMNAVIGMTEIAKHHLDDPVYAKTCLDKVTTSGNHLLTLINDILDISMVESGKMALNPTNFSVRATAVEMYEMMQEWAEDKNIAVSLSFADITEETVFGDSLRLKQILLNLLSNAIKYTENGGTVHFRVAEQPTRQPDAVCLCYEISDTGMGMSEEFQQTMYSTFTRAADSKTSSIQGSGLGLAIVKQMVDLMGGSIACRSALGEGTTFFVEVTLPIAKQPQTHTAADSAETTGTFAGLRILVAEDNDLNWEIIHVMLAEYGILTERAENGQVCLDLLAEKGAAAYDLILMDVQMPLLDGKETTREIRRRKEIGNIPIVAMTADAFAEDVSACLEAGMDGHLSKPVDMRRLVSLLTKLKNGALRREETE